MHVGFVFKVSWPCFERQIIQEDCDTTIASTCIKIICIRRLSRFSRLVSSTSSPVRLREVYIVVCDSFRLRFEGLSELVAFCCSCNVWIYFVSTLSSLVSVLLVIFLDYSNSLALPSLSRASFTCLSWFNMFLEDTSAGCRYTTHYTLDLHTFFPLVCSSLLNHTNALNCCT